jgi:hypothetical protein
VLGIAAAAGIGTIFVSGAPSVPPMSIANNWFITAPITSLTSGTVPFG